MQNLHTEKLKHFTLRTCLSSRFPYLHHDKQSFVLQELVLMAILMFCDVCKLHVYTMT